MELLRRDNSEVFWSLSMPVTVKWNPLPSLAVFARIAPSVSGDYLSRHNGTTSTPEYSVITTNVNRVNVIARYAFSDRFSVALQPTFASSVGLAALEGTYRF
jgi:hypothetical protein